MVGNLTITSVYVRGIRDTTKRGRVFEWCKTKKSSIVFLQETFSTVDIEERWRSDWGGNGVFSHGTNHSKGVAIMFGADLDLHVKQLLVDNEGRKIFIKWQIQGERIRVLSLGTAYCQPKTTSMTRMTLRAPPSNQKSLIFLKHSLWSSSGSWTPAAARTLCPCDTPIASIRCGSLLTR